MKPFNKITPHLWLESKYLTVDPIPGTHLSIAIEESLQLSKNLNCRIKFKFNDKKFSINAADGLAINDIIAKNYP